MDGPGRQRSWRLAARRTAMSSVPEDERKYAGVVTKQQRRRDENYVEAASLSSSHPGLSLCPVRDFVL